MVDNNISCELNKKRTTVTKDTIEGLKETIRNLYLADDIPWVIGYSGGKDSTATLQLVWLAIEELSAKQLKNAKKIHVINTDTMVESPVISKWVRDSLEIMDIRAEQSGLPFVTHRLTPETDNTFWVNLLGRGYPFPRKKLRWCTDRLKIQPVNKFVKEQIAEHGEIILVIGTRKAESARRAKTMAYYEKKRVRELLSPSSTMANELVFSPLEDWTDDDVWIFLMQYRNPWGYSNTDLLTLYRGATADNECPLMVEKGLPSCGKSRFGCWVCTMVEKDKSMEAMIANDDEKAYNMLSFSAHKLKGPQGVGVLVLRKKRYRLPPVKNIMYGGQQEHGIRPGTIPVALVAGCGEACEIAEDEYKENSRKLKSLKGTLEQLLNDSGADYHYNGEQNCCIDSTVNICFKGVMSEALMLSSKQYCSVSNGSACTSKSYSPSYVLEAMGIPVEDIESSVRISWEPETNKTEFIDNVSKMIEIAKSLAV